jgi:hypothetical protein
MRGARRLASPARPRLVIARHGAAQGRSSRSARGLGVPKNGFGGPGADGG